MLMKKSIVARTLILCMLLTAFVQNGLLLSRANAAAGEQTTIIINDTEVGPDVNQFQYVGPWGTSTGVTGNYNGDEHWLRSQVKSLQVHNSDDTLGSRPAIGLTGFLLLATR
ncbi:hypothetical protein [Paenibacillus guangzhouensis]|uniref:hypothetical protein n=1 Tax=Paenibacillus guangzhouensis TaxID=1473112 RepID=UPI001266BE4F|nr:hypothetical protein [Paenibacillus guangzhouensis]